MRVNLALILFALFFTSCDDGDIIVTTFEFGDETFSMCSDERNKVLYHISDQDVFETLTIAASNPAFSSEGTQLIRGIEPLALPLESNRVSPVTIVLTGNNEVVYRTYDGAVPNNYFCRAIPPSSPRVLQEYKSVGGEIVITTGITYNSGNQGLDHDNDGIPSNLEGINSLQDTDNDGIPDYLDIDDDGDNVPTSIERTVSDGEDPTAEGYADTDGDGIPNYLDPDDDNDGVPTIREISEENASPSQNFNEARDRPRYLDRFAIGRFEGEVAPQEANTVPVRYTSVVEAHNLKLKNQGGDGEEISFVNKLLGIFNSGQRNVLISPREPEDEEVPNG